MGDRVYAVENHGPEKIISEIMPLLKREER